MKRETSVGVRAQGLWFRSLVWLVLLLQSAYAHAESAQSSATVLRDPKVPCGLYLAKVSNTSTGHKVADLNRGDIERWAKRSPELNSEEDVLFIVGASPNTMMRRGWVRETKRLLSENDLDVAVRTIRRLPEEVKDVYGLYLYDSDHRTLERAADLESGSIEAYLAENSLQGKRPWLVGVPLFGKERRGLEELVQDKLSAEGRDERVRKINKVLVRIRHFVQTLRFAFPLPEDFPKPTEREMTNAASKLFIPGVLTFIVNIFKYPMVVTVPLTLTNATNSAATGVFRAGMVNWRNRMKGIAGRLTCDLILTSIFTTNLYWASRGNWDATMAVTTLAGWETFIRSKWATAVFNIVWRTPFHNYVALRERRLTKEGGAEGNERVRDENSTLEFYTSLVMTQFYLYSTATKSQIMTGNDFIDGTFRLDIGKVVMLGFGTFSALSLVAPKITAPLVRRYPDSKWIRRLDGAANNMFYPIFKTIHVLDQKTGLRRFNTWIGTSVKNRLNRWKRKEVPLPEGVSP